MQRTRLLCSLGRCISSQFQATPRGDEWISTYTIFRSLCASARATTSARSDLSSLGARRAFSNHENVQSQIDAINRLFAEARDEIETAREDAETVYFNESVQEARNLTEKTLKAFEHLLRDLPERDRNALQRSMGLKMEQLKAELSGLDELHA